ncbi:hypothetical protein QBC37DRAFT_373154 [Rhypophila decipiens]|uniref:Uncharacterized protein n=1 Tax=Rhypophila decipiens TaxID=261697 RepID=A0AAN6YCU3_9PEZI|nr:hypothetical protein QBC37DRAFT_373154 [Rhypophila decipiens]
MSTQSTRLNSLGTDTNNGKKTFSKMRPQFNIARAFKDCEEVALHVATLEGPNEHYNVQIVKHVGSGTLLVRKTTHTRRRVGYNLTEAQAHFNKDIMAAQHISEAYDADQSNARFAQLYAVNTIQPDMIRHGSKLTLVSYWSFCNGAMVDGGLERFMDRCDESGVSLPDGLIIRFAWNMLESLFFLYTLPTQRLRIANDNSLSDLPLHFRPGNDLPDLFVANFGDSERIPVEGSRTAEGGDEWDIPRVKLMINYLYHRSETIQRTRRRCKSCNKMLNDLDSDFDAGKIGFPPLDGATFAPADFSILPYLQTVIRFANRHAMHTCPEGSNVWKQLSGWEKWEKSGIPTFESIYATRREKLRGPWYVALVDKNTNELVGLDENKTYHTPKNESIDEDTDYESDDEVSEASDLE